MAGKDNVQKLNKIFETGISVAKIAQAKAEEALKDAVHLSEVQRNQFKEIVEETVKKSKKNSDFLIKSLSKEIEKQFSTANGFTRQEIEKLSDRLNSMSQELGKLSLVKDELSKLSEVVNSLAKMASKFDPSQQSHSNVDPSEKADPKASVTNSSSKGSPSTSAAKAKTAPSSKTRSSARSTPSSSPSRRSGTSRSTTNNGPSPDKGSAASGSAESPPQSK